MRSAELAGPAVYSSLWLALGIALPLLVVAWYALVTWWASGFARPGPRGPSWRAVRRTHLARIDTIEREAASGALTPRAAHRGLSEVLRSYAAAVGEPAARSPSRRLPLPAPPRGPQLRPHHCRPAASGQTP